MATVAERVAAHKARKRRGEILITLKADEVALVDSLVAARILSPAIEYDRAAICKAAERVLEIFAREKI